MTPKEARIAHVVTTIIGLGIIVAGFLVQHKGATLPTTGMTVGGAMSAVSSWRFVQSVENASRAGYAWVLTHQTDVDNLKAAVKALAQLLPPDLEARLSNLDMGVQAAGKNAAAAITAVSNQPDTKALISQVLSGLLTQAQAKQVTGSVDSKQATAPVPDVAGQDVTPVAPTQGGITTSPPLPAGFNNPPVVTPASAAAVTSAVVEGAAN